MSWWLDSSDMVLVLGVIFSGFTGCLVAYCQQQRKSRCSNLVLCWGCVKCERLVESDELVLAEEAMESKRVSAPIPRERSASVDEEVPDRGQI